MSLHRIQFTGSHLLAFGREIPATCIIRNELNGLREAHEVVRTMGSTVPHGLAYMPRPFPAGQWLVTGVRDMAQSTEYWPAYIATNATRLLPVWITDHGRYFKATDKLFTDRGLGIHHARFLNGGQLVPSRTTLGCINVLDPNDAEWIGGVTREIMETKDHIALIVPEWEEWESWAA